MWMLVWRPFVILLGLGGLGEAAGVVAVVSGNPVGSSVLMYWVLLMMAIQAAVAIGCLVAGLWGPISRLFEHQ